MSYRYSPWAIWAYNSECGTSLHNSNSVGGRCGRDRHGSGCKAFESHDFELGPVRYLCTAPPRSLSRSTAGYLAKRDKMELSLMLTPTQSPCVGRHLGGTAKCPRCDADGGDHLAVEVTVIGTQLAQQDADRFNAMIARVAIVPGQCFGQKVLVRGARFSTDLLPLKGATSRAVAGRLNKLGEWNITTDKFVLVSASAASRRSLTFETGEPQAAWNLRRKRFCDLARAACQYMMRNARTIGQIVIMR